MVDPNTTEINQALTRQPNKSLYQRLAMLNRLGWLVAFVLLIAFIAQSLVFTFSPRQILTADPASGAINGVVLFNDVLARDNTTVIRDLKAWTSSRLSLNSATIFEDAQIAINHLCAELQQQLLAEWQQTAYLASIQQSRGVAKVEFDDSDIQLQRDASGSNFAAVIGGKVLIGAERSSSRPFRIRLGGKLLPKTQNTSLGIEVCDYADI